MRRCYDVGMARTTLSIDDDVLEAAKALARADGRSIGTVLSELARRGLRPPTRRRKAGAFPTFEVPKDAKPISSEDVLRALDEHA